MHKPIGNLFARILLGATLLAGNGMAIAHHSFAMFDKDKTRVLNGVVKSYQQVNPHGYLQLMVTTSTGKVQEWSIEASAVAVMKKYKIDTDTFKPGDHITVTINPLRNGTTGGQFLYAKLPDGSIVGDHPDSK